MALPGRRPSMPTTATTTAMPTTTTIRSLHAPSGHVTPTARDIAIPPAWAFQGRPDRPDRPDRPERQGRPDRLDGPDGPDDTLARWLALTEQAATDRTGRAFWQLTTSPTFAELWYEARAAGERLRARAVAALYAHHAHPGGRHPDPRSRVSYSERALVAHAFRQLSIPIFQQPPCVQHDDREPLALLMTYPRADQLPPRLIIHAETQAVSQALLLFHMACMLGFITRDYARLLDADAPHGPTLLPTSRGAREVLHQFAFAFLYLKPECPPEWRCQCHAIRARFNAPPAEHDQPTDTLSLADLQSTLQAQTRADDDDHADDDAAAANADDHR